MAKPPKKDIDIYLGDDYTFSFQLTLNSAPIDLTGRTYRAQVRETAGAVDPLFEFTVDLSAAATGIVTLTLDHATTTDLVTPRMAGGASEQICAWDVKQTAGVSDLTVLQGNATLIRNKTR